MREKHIIFIDNAGRTILGEKSEENGNKLTVKNPVMIIVQQSENGQMAVQLFPLFFAEFVTPVGDKRDNYFTYNVDTIAIAGGFEADSRILEQYSKVVNPQLVPQSNTETVKLFDEE